MNGKGDRRRPCLIGNEMYSLRYDLATGAITESEFNCRVKELASEEDKSKGND